MTTRRGLNFENYASNLDSLAGIAAEIDRLEGFDERTQSQDSKLEALRGSFRVLDEMRKIHERQCLVQGISFDGREKLTAHAGHTPKDIDDYDD